MISILLSNDESFYQCDLDPSVLDDIDCLVWKYPRVVDGFGERTISTRCRFCKKDRLVLVAEICEIEFISPKNKLKRLTISGSDSYSLQNKIHILNEDSCKCQI